MPLRLSGSTGVSGIDGTAQAPAVQGTNPNAGIYYSGNNVIVSTSGNTALTVGPSGNVAISNSFSISGQYVTPYSGMMKNRIINGDFKIDQRFAGAANNNIATIQYVVDRWANDGGAAAKLRFQQNNTNGPGQTATQAATGFSNYFGANVVSSNTVNAGDYWYMFQNIEGLNISDLGWGTANASPVTLSFWVYSSIPGTHGGSINNGLGNRSYPFTYSVNTANTWQYQTITVPGDTTGSWFSNNNIGISLFLDLGIGTTYSASAVNNAWVAGVTGNRWPTGTVKVVSAANGSFYLTGVQLEKGSQATPFEFRHFTTELQLCQRYFCKSYSTSVAPGTSTNNGQQRTVSAGGAGYLNFTFPVEMRTEPSTVGYNLTGTAGVYGSDVGNWTSTATYISTRQFHVDALVTSGQWVYGHYTASAELGVQN